MRFGIMAMQLDVLIPSQTAPDQIAASVMALEHATLVREIASASGFSLIELGGDLMLFFPQFYAPPAIEKLAALKAEMGLRYTVHLPLWSVEPSTPLTPVREGSVRAVVECIKATLPLEPEVYVLHATGALAAEFYRMRLPELARTLLLQQFQSQARSSLKAILAETGIPSRKLAVETVEFPFDLTLQLAERLDLSICFDTGHVLVGFAGPVDFFTALERCLPRLAEVHLHDAPRYDPTKPLGYGQDHRALGKGDLDVGRLLDRLAAVGWDGPLIFELTISQALESLNAVRALRPALVSG